MIMVGRTSERTPAARSSDSLVWGNVPVAPPLEVLTRPSTAEKING
jgi:hypothetical protein